MTEEQRQDYANSVWEAAGGGRILSSAEWHVLRGWMESGAPLRIVLRGIQDTNKPSRSLLYYQPAVNEAILRWRRLMGAA